MHLQAADDLSISLLNIAPPYPTQQSIVSIDSLVETGIDYNTIEIDDSRAIPCIIVNNTSQEMNIDALRKIFGPCIEKGDYNSLVSFFYTKVPPCKEETQNIALN